MAGVRFSCLKRLQKISAGCCCLNSKSIQPNHLTRTEIFAKNQLITRSSVNRNLLNNKARASFSPNFSSFWIQKSLPFASTTLLLNRRSYSSSPSDNGAGDSVDISDWAHDLTPSLQQLPDSNPFREDLVIPVGATVIAWIVIPPILRSFHEKAMQSAAATFLGSKSGEKVPYEKSFWGALENPLRYLVIFVAFSHVSAPTSEASQKLAEAWKEAVIVLFTWVLHQWKTNVLGQISRRQSFLGHAQHDKLLTLNKVSSAGILGIGSLALAEASGVPVQSIATVVAIGGVAAAFAARDVLGNVLSGLSMQYWEPSTIGDTIKAGCVEGQVIEMGVTTTSVVNAKKLTVIVPNSYFCRQGKDETRFAEQDIWEKAVEIMKRKDADIGHTSHLSDSDSDYHKL